MADASVGDLKNQVRARIEELLPELYTLSDDIFAHPEVRYEEYYAAETISNFLKQHGMDVETGVGNLPTAFVARVPGHQSGPRVGILAEYDALPGLGHACGHNLIGTAAVGAFLALASLAGELKGSVTLFGTPAEEGGAGKVVLLEQDVFDGLDAVMMTHPNHKPTVVDNPFLGAGSVAIQFHGKPAHAAAAPTDGINAVDAMVMTYVGVNGLRQRIPRDVNIASMITSGGKAVNIIPDFAEIVYRIRAEKWQRAAKVMDQVIAIAEGCAAGIGATVTTVKKYGHRAEFPFYTEDKQNEALKGVFRENLDALDLPHEPFTPEMGMGSTDFANVSQEIPGMHLMLHLEGSQGRPPHTVEFAEAAGSQHGRPWLKQAASVMAMSAIDILNREGTLEQIRAEHHAAAD